MNKGNENSCTCDQCKKMCNRPCWPTPEEAKKLIERGFGTSLMLDYWIGGLDENGGDVFILCPALTGSEGMDAPFTPIGKCTMQNEAGLCQLHDIGLKPKEGRLALHGRDTGNLHEEIAKMWDSEDARKVVEMWRERK